MELNAEARGPKKGRREAGTLKGLLNRPMKRGLDLTDARKRRLVDLRGSPPRANGLEAELEGRLLLEGRWEKLWRQNESSKLKLLLERKKNKKDVLK